MDGFFFFSLFLNIETLSTCEGEEEKVPPTLSNGVRLAKGGWGCRESVSSAIVYHFQRISSAPLFQVSIFRTDAFYLRFQLSDGQLGGDPSWGPPFLSSFPPSQTFEAPHLAAASSYARCQLFPVRDSNNLVLLRNPPPKQRGRYKIERK